MHTMKLRFRKPERYNRVLHGSRANSKPVFKVSRDISRGVILKMLRGKQTKQKKKK